MANAADELTVHVYGDSVSSAMTIKLDGDTKQSINKDGINYFDLAAGTHSIQLLEAGEPVHSFRFDSARGQYVDIKVGLSDSKSPAINIENFSKVESLSETKNAARGFLTGKVMANGGALSGATISVLGRDDTAMSAQDGSYSIELPRGFYSVSVNHPAYSQKNINDYRVISNVTSAKNISLSKISNTIEEVTVVAKVKHLIWSRK